MLIDRNPDAALKIRPLIMTQSTPHDLKPFQARRFFYDELLTYLTTDSERERLESQAHIANTIAFIEMIGNKRLASDYFGFYVRAQSKK